jgi:hypothetical protein
MAARGSSCGRMIRLLMKEHAAMISDADARLSPVEA